MAVHQLLGVWWDQHQGMDPFHLKIQKQKQVRNHLCVLLKYSQFCNMYSLLLQLILWIRYCGS